MSAEECGMGSDNWTVFITQAERILGNDGTITLNELGLGGSELQEMFNKAEKDHNRVIER